MSTDETSGVASSSGDHSLAIRAVWFVCVGWWATGVWLTVAWLLNVSILGIPLGIKMINMVPKVLSLKEREFVTEGDAAEEQTYGLVVRGIYFLFVGWWASGVWTSIAYAFTLSIVGIPIAVMMYNKLPFVVSLYDY